MPLRNIDILFAVAGGVSTIRDLGRLLMPHLSAKGATGAAAVRMNFELPKLVTKRLIEVEPGRGAARWVRITPLGLAYLVEKQTAARIQRRRKSSWRKPEDCLVITRPGILGNPFRPTSREFRFEAIAAFKHWADGMVDGDEMSLEMGGRICFTAQGGTTIVRRGRRAVFPNVVVIDPTKERDREPWLEAVAGIANRGSVCCYCAPGEWCHGDVLIGLDQELIRGALCAGRFV